MSSTKKLMAEINRIAKSLPEQFEVRTAKVKMTGADVHLSGLSTEGIPNDETEHLLTIPIYVPVNHKRRLANAHKKNEIIGIINYVNSVYDNPVLNDQGEAIKPVASEQI